MESTIRPDNQKYLVTGCAGFIGSHLTDRLLDSGAIVVGVDNLSNGRQVNLRKALANPRFKFYESDVNDLALARKIVRAESTARRFDVAWHMAANSDIRAGQTDPDLELRDTFLTTFSLIKLMREFAIPRIAFASTSAIYGEQNRVLAEEAGPVFPISHYGAMKLASEAMISASLEIFLEKAWIFRFPNVVGSRATHGVIHDLAHKLRRNPALLEVLGDGTQTKPYCHVSELVEGMIFIFKRACEKLNVFNIGPPDSATSVSYIAESVVRYVALGAIIRYGRGQKGWAGDVPRFRYSVEKLRLLGWLPSLTSDQAVDRAVAEIAAEVLQ